MASIKPAFHGARKAHVMLTLSLSGPWLRVPAQPSFAFGFPLSAQPTRDSISKSKRDEINCSLLLPMGQAIRSETDAA